MIGGSSLEQQSTQLYRAGERNAYDPGYLVSAFHSSKSWWLRTFGHPRLIQGTMPNLLRQGHYEGFEDLRPARPFAHARA